MPINPHAGLVTARLALFPGEDPEAGTGVKHAQDPGAGKGGRKRGARAAGTRSTFLLSRLSGHTDPPPQLPCLLGSGVKVRRDSPVLFPRRKHLMKIDVSWKDDRETQRHEM